MSPTAKLLEAAAGPSLIEVDNTGITRAEQTTLIPNEEEAFALEPADTIVVQGRLVIPYMVVILAIL